MTRPTILMAVAGAILLHIALKTSAQLTDGFNDVTMRIPVKNDTTTIKASIWLPAHYSPSKKYALLIYAQAHPQADSATDTLLSEGLPAILRGGFEPPFDCIVIFPRGESGNPAPEWLSGIIRDARNQFSVDTTRIYLIGIAEGGYFCFGSQLNTSPELSKKIAALCIISGNTQHLQWNNIDAWIRNKTPVWLIVSQSDRQLLHDNIAVANALNQQQPGMARISIPTGIGTQTTMNIFDGTYHDNGPDLWKWFHQYVSTPVPVYHPSHPTHPHIAAAKPTTEKTEKAKVVKEKPKAPAIRKTRIPILVQDGQVYCTEVDKVYSPQPGDTLVIPTGIISALLRNFSGSAEKPIVVLPADSGWIGGYSSYALVITNAKYFKAIGFHLDGHNKSDICMAIGQQTSDYEIARCVIRNSLSMGLMAKQDPDPSSPQGSYPGFTIRNVSIHDITVRNTGTEGFYIGYTFDKITPLASPLVNVTIHHIDIDSTGWDGLQLSNCQQVSLHDVSIRHFGLKDQSSQRSGLLLGGMVTIRDSVCRVNISNGTGVGLLIFGRGLQRFSDIRLLHTGLTQGELAIYVSDYRDLGYGLPPLQLQMRNIHIDGSAGRALMVNNERRTMLPGRIEKLTYTNTGGGIQDDVDKIIK